MLKKLGIPTLVLAAVMAAVPAQAAIRFGVGIGGPVYARPTRITVRLITDTRIQAITMADRTCTVRGDGMVITGITGTAVGGK